MANILLLDQLSGVISSTFVFNLLFIGGGFIICYIIIHMCMAYRQWHYQINCLSKLPGINYHPLLGALSEFPGPGEDGLTFIRQLVQIYPRIAQLFLGPVLNIVAVMHPDSIKTILKTSEPKPHDLSAYFFVLPWLGDGLLLSGGKKWSRNRRFLTPAFHSDILKPYIKINNTAAECLMNKIQSSADCGEYFEVFSAVSLCTLEVILKCAFTFDEDIQNKGESHPYVKAVQTMTSGIVHRVLRPWLYPTPIFYLTPAGQQFKRSCNFVHSVASDVIKRRKKTLALTKLNGGTKSGRVLDFLDILLTAKDDKGNGLSDIEIRNEVDTFLFEGHDTTASGISWLLYSLAENLHWQHQCQQEIDDILQNRQSQEILWDDLPNLTILTACVKEALRHHTPVPVIERYTTKDMYIDGHFIPRHSHIQIHLYAMMHNTEVWKDPMTYNPGRFLNASDSNKDSYAFLPFSAGPRNCIGQHFAMHEIKVIVGRILKRFTLTLDPNRPAKHELSIVMKTENGMFLNGCPRPR